MARLSSPLPIAKTGLGLALVCQLLAANAWADEYRIDRVAKPVKQSIKLSLDPAQEQYQGSVQIELDLLRASASLQFNGLDYTLDTVKISGAASCLLKTVMGEHGVVTASCDHRLPAGHYQLNMEFNAPYNHQSVGIYKTMDQDLPYLFSQFEMSDARRAFPVFDEPEYKIPFQLTIRAPKTLNVYANTPELKKSTQGEWTTHEFAATKPIPSYLVAMAVGQFEEVEVTGMHIPGRVITTKGKSAMAHYAAQQIPKILTALEKYFGRPYPYAKLDAMALPEYPFGAMENVGLITYRDDVLLLDEDNAGTEQKSDTIDTITHEMAHQWYGDLVTMRWWNDLWLNEAFASWMAAKIVQQEYPELETNLSLPQNSAMAEDALLSTQPIRKPIKTDADIMDGLGLAYSKGSAILSQVEQWVGPVAFRQGIRNYINAHAFKNAEAADLWNALGAASHKDVAAVLSSFIEQPSYPQLHIDLHGKTLGIQQQRFVYPGSVAPAQHWSVPVNIKYGKGNSVKTTSVLLNKDTAKVELAFVPDWVFPDTDAKGYYRFILSDSLREKSLPYFDEQHLNTRERLSLVAGSTALMEAGKLDIASFLTIMGKMLNDNHPRVVNSALSRIAAQRDVFIDSSNEVAWAKYTQQLSKNAFNRYGLSSKPDDAVGVDRLRNSLLELMALEAKDAVVIDECRKQTELYLVDDSKVDSTLADSYLGIAAYFGDKVLYDKMLKVFESTNNPQVRSSLLVALNSFNDADLQRSALDYLLTDKITASDLRYIFYYHMSREDRAGRMHAWLFQHFAEVVKKTPPFAVPAIPEFMVSTCSVDSLNTAEKFIEPHLKETPDYARTLTKLSESVHKCVSLRDRESASFNHYLQGFQER